MGFVQRFERRLEGAVDDAFARVFGGKIMPAEVETALRREASDGLRVQGGRSVVPNHYVLTVSDSDEQNLTADAELTLRSFATHLAGYIDDQGWQTYGDVSVELQSSPNLHTGQFRARSALDPDAGSSPDAGFSVSSEPVPMQPRPEPRGGRPAPPPSERAGAVEAAGAAGAAGAVGGALPSERYRPGAMDRLGASPAPPPDDERARPDERYGQAYAQRGYGGYGQGGYAQPAEPGQPEYERRGYDRSGAQQDHPADQGRAPGAPPQGVPGPEYGPADERGQDYPGPGPQGYAHFDYAGPGQGYPGPGYGAPGPQHQDYSAGDHRAGEYGAPGYADPRYPQQGYADQDRFQDGRQQGYPPQDYQAQEYTQGYPQQGYPQTGGYGAWAQPRTQGVRLVLDDGSGRTFDLRQGSNVIGRGQASQFRIPDTGVSRQHADVQWDGAVALLVDLNSTNGTVVNGTPVTEWQLAHGDIIRVGHTDIAVRFR